MPFTLGWDLVGTVDKLGEGVNGLQSDQMVAALPVVGGYSEFVCLRASELVVVPPGLDPAEAICMVLNYATAYQMLHRVAHIKTNERVLIHSAAGGVGTALLQLSKLIGVNIYGTASLEKHDLVVRYGGVPIDYKKLDFVKEIYSLTGDGVDAVFDGVGGKYLQRSYDALRYNGRLVAYGLAATLQNGHSNGGLVISNIRDWLNAFKLNLRPSQPESAPFQHPTLKAQASGLVS